MDDREGLELLPLLNISFTAFVTISLFLRVAARLAGSWRFDPQPWAYSRGRLSISLPVLVVRSDDKNQGTVWRMHGGGLKQPHSWSGPLLHIRWQWTAQLRVPSRVPSLLPVKLASPGCLLTPVLAFSSQLGMQVHHSTEWNSTESFSVSIVRITAWGAAVETLERVEINTIFFLEVLTETLVGLEDGNGRKCRVSCFFLHVYPNGVHETSSIRITVRTVRREKLVVITSIVGWSEKKMTDESRRDKWNVSRQK